MGKTATHNHLIYQRCPINRLVNARGAEGPSTLDWRHDYADSLPLGEAIAISLLNDMAYNWNEPSTGVSL
jgi:hypothetical protein